MPITRPGETPSFYEYAVKYALRPSTGEWPQSVEDFDPNPIVIPPYQRKIVWGEEEIKEFLESKSILFGTIILASEGQDKPLILLDGLQRFATATAILHYLYPLVLSPDPTYKDIQPKFKRLAGEVASKQPIIAYNHEFLMTGIIRTGIKSSYSDLYKSVKQVVDNELKEKPDEFASNVVKTLVSKQIAIDTYYGFKGKGELIQTFININSTGLILTEVDLLRSEIMQQAENLQWDDTDIIAVENDFTELFQSAKVRGADVLGKHLYDAFIKDSTKIFKNWHALEKNDVDHLLNFIENTYKYASQEDDDGNLINPYLFEILQCGRVPFAITTWFFYKKMQHEGKDPNSINDDFYSLADSRKLLRAFYRRIVDASISRIGSIAASVIQNKDYESADDVVKKLVTPDMGDFSDPSETWIGGRLRKSNLDRSRRIFNACLLPDRDKDEAFRPLRYGSKKDDWNVDHLIPKAQKQKNQKGGDEFNLIVNLAPLHSKLNKNIKNHPCKRKLRSDGVYGDLTSEHPYIDWLVNEHYNKYKDQENVLDDQEFLVVNSKPSIGDERIAKIAEILQNKL